MTSIGFEVFYPHIKEACVESALSGSGTPVFSPQGPC